MPRVATEAATWQETWTAIGTVGAVVVALLFGASAELRRLMTRRRAQAEQISAWAEEEPVSESQFRHVGFILNASGEPVWDITVFVDSVRRETADELDPRAEVVERIQIGMLPPGRKEKRTYQLEFMPYAPDSPVPLVFFFRDNAGRWWFRDEKGQLKRRSGPPKRDAWFPAWRLTHPDPRARIDPKNPPSGY